MSFINSRILNKKGLAESIWNDISGDNLRKRLSSKVEKKTLTSSEKRSILEKIETLLNEARNDLQ